ncbi:hypothetical protein BJX64DRAFT_260007 [Aspergillus heterothallicus]
MVHPFVPVSATSGHASIRQRITNPLIRMLFFEAISPGKRLSCHKSGPLGSPSLDSCSEEFPDGHLPQNVYFS